MRAQKKGALASLDDEVTPRRSGEARHGLLLCTSAHRYRVPAPSLTEDIERIFMGDILLSGQLSATRLCALAGLSYNFDLIFFDADIMIFMR